jgi:hypothetical protein
MPAFKDITGQRFGRLVAKRPAAQYINNRCYLWLCECDCGEITFTKTSNLTSGCTQSCGCLRAEVTAKRSKTHGLSRTPEYYAWWNAIERCHDPCSPFYEDYGYRGIKVCHRWRKNPGGLENFIKDMGTRPGLGYSLDRIDYDGPYAPWNCRWADSVTQATNKRGVKLNPLKVTEIKRLLTTHMKQSRIAKKFGVNQPTISNIKRGVTWKEV